MSNNRKSITNDNNRNILTPEIVSTLHIFDTRFTNILQSGHTTLLNATLSDLNDSGNPNWLMPATATTLSFVSTSTEDAFPSGTGLTILALDGLDQNLDPIQDVVFLSGTTPVVSNLSFRALNVAVAIGGGTPGSGAVGTITITASSDSQVFGRFLVNDTSCEVGRYTVARNHRLLVHNLMINAGKGANVTLKSELTRENGFPVSIGELYPSEGNFSWDAVGFYESGETFKARAFYNSGGSGTRYMSLIVGAKLAPKYVWDEYVIKN